MLIELKKYSIVLLAYFLFIMPMVTSDFLDTERSSFLGFTHEQFISPSTLELVEQLTSVVYESVHGDRRVRRYFDNYDTPFYDEQQGLNKT